MFTMSGVPERAAPRLATAGLLALSLWLLALPALADVEIGPFDRANRALLTGDRATAERLYRQVLADQSSPDREAAMYLLGLCLDQPGRWKEAEAVLRRLLADFPDSEYADDALMLMGRHYARSPRRSDLIQAIKLFLIIPRRYPGANTLNEAMLAAGEALAQVGEYRRAEAILCEAVEKLDPPRRVNALFALGQVYSNPANPNRDPRQAQAMYRRIIEEYPDYERMPAVLFALGSCSRSLQEWDEAHEIFQQLVEEYPDDYFAPFARSYLALIRREKHEQELSLKKFLDALRAQPPAERGSAQRGDPRVLVDLLRGGSDKLAIEADVMDFQRDKNLARYEGNVTVRGDGWQVQADTVEVDLSRKTIEGYGHIQLQKGSRMRLEGQRISLDMAAHQAVAVGDAVLRKLTPQGEQVIRQERLVISIGDGDNTDD